MSILNPTKDSYSIRGKACNFDDKSISIEFGKTQADLIISRNGSIQRYLKLQKGDHVIVTIVKVRRK